MNDRFRTQPGSTTMEHSISELIDLVESGKLKGLVITCIANDGRTATRVNGTATVEQVQQALLHSAAYAREKNGVWDE